MRRWKIMTKMTIGIVMMTAAAAIDPIGKVNWDTPVKKPIAAGAVRAEFVDVSEMASRNSFQQNMHTRMAGGAVPGGASGAITFRKICRCDAPSTFAAFSRSQGISRKNADSV